tara:strand:- start:319 stop:1185 length:867 start_codon:yes stop_codon:yes gene_type:complete
MKRSRKVTVGIILFFVVVISVISARTAMGVYFKKKFGTRPPPGVIVEVVTEKQFSQTIESYCTAISSKTVSFKIKKNELLEPINIGAKVKKGNVIAKLQSKNIIAPFSGKTGTRGISSSILGTDSIILTLDDSKNILCDLQIPEVFAAVLKKGLKVNAKFSAYKGKEYIGVIESVTSRIDAQTRSILVRAKIKNNNLEILPGSLLEVTVNYNQGNSLGIPDTSVLLEGNKAYVYKISEENLANKTEVVIGLRNKGNIEIISGLSEGDIIVAEGLKKVRPRGKVNPINK